MTGILEAGSAVLTGRSKGTMDTYGVNWDLHRVTEGRSGLEFDGGRGEAGIR